MIVKSECVTEREKERVVVRVVATRISESDGLNEKKKEEKLFVIIFYFCFLTDCETKELCVVTYHNVCVCLIFFSMLRRRIC